MKTILSLVTIVLLISCSKVKTTGQETNTNSSFTIAFGSCNNQNIENTFWNDILKNNPDVWIWGGDIIYADTEDMKKMASDYEKVKTSMGYKKLTEKIEILGTWDDHDYGKNDAGLEYIKKDSSQQLFLNFLDVAQNDSRRKRKGVYHSKVFNIRNKSIKVIVLDTRYFRTNLTKDSTGVKRYIPNKTNEGTILGDTQWKWLTSELKNSKSEFNIIVTSIQFLSQEHGWETWGNIPNEVLKMQDLIITSKAKNVIFLSGDRHISEISMAKLSDLNYPLYDFTSSGLTHSYEAFESEPNKHRVTKVISKNSFGVLTFNLNTNSVTMEMRGNENLILESIKQQY